MADEVTSTDRKLLYKVRYSPGGEEMFFEGSGAVNVQYKGIGWAALHEISYNGMDVVRATENEITDFYGHDEEE